MKLTTFLLIGFFFVFLSSCNKETERSYSEVETMLNVEIPLLSTTNPDNLKSNAIVAKEDFLFSGTNNYRVNDLVNASGKVTNVHTIKSLNGSVLSVPGIEQGYEINSLLLNLGYKTSNSEDFMMEEPINLLALNYTISNKILQVNIDEAINQLIGGIESPDVTIMFNITGKSDFNLSGTANLQIPVIVESEINTPRFELY